MEIKRLQEQTPKAFQMIPNIQNLHQNNLRDSINTLQKSVVYQNQSIPQKYNQNLAKQQNGNYNETIKLQNEANIQEKIDHDQGEIVELDELQLIEQQIQELEGKEKIKLTEKKYLEKLRKQHAAIINERNNPQEKNINNTEGFDGQINPTSSNSDLLLPLVRKPKNKYGFDDNVVQLIREDCQRIKNEIQRSPQNVKMRQKIKQEQKTSFNLKDVFQQKQKNQDVQQMLEGGGGELIINQLISYINEKKGFVNRKEQCKELNQTIRNREMQMISNSSSNTKLSWQSKLINNSVKSKNILDQRSMLNKSQDNTRINQKRDLMSRESSFMQRFQRENLESQMKKLNDDFKLSNTVQQDQMNSIISKLNEVSLSNSSLDQSVDLYRDQSTSNILITDMECTPESKKNQPNQYIESLFKPQLDKNESPKQFSNLMNKISLQYGYNPQFKTRKQEFMTLSQRRIVQKINVNKKGQNDALDFDGDEKSGIADAMKDEKMVERYSKHLNNCFFITNDKFLKNKHARYLQKVSPKHEASFFKRMDQDQQVRAQKQLTQINESQLSSTSLTNAFKNKFQKSPLLSAYKEGSSHRKFNEQSSINLNGQNQYENSDFKHDERKNLVVNFIISPTKIQGQQIEVSMFDSNDSPNV
eukprot:403343445